MQPKYILFTIMNKSCNDRLQKKIQDLKKTLPSVSPAKSEGGGLVKTVGTMKSGEQHLVIQAPTGEQTQVILPQHISKYGWVAHLQVWVSGKKSLMY